jgi:fumarate reductase (CoM/CoB) subunit B
MEKGTATVFRYDPESDKGPRYESHEFPFTQGMSVLDVALYIYENIDPTFSFSYSCSNSHCGLCAAKINGRPGLMCRESATKEIRLEPLDLFPVIRDLMIDRSDYEVNTLPLRLFLDRETPPPRGPEKVDMDAHARFKVVSRCVECFSCLSNCPAYGDGRHEFLGPAGFVQLARHAFDPRDDLNREVMVTGAGVYNCTNCRQCSMVCPHEIAPRDNIMLLRNQVVAAGQAPAGVRQLIETVKKTGKAMLPPKSGKSSLGEITGARKGRVGYFVGCTFDYDPQLKPAALGGLEVLKKIGVDPVVPPEQICCGTPLHEAGETALIEDLVTRNVQAFVDAGCTDVVAVCSGCSWAGKNLWPEIYRKATGREMPLSVFDFTEYMARQTTWAPKTLKSLNTKVTYHDSCLLNRGQEIREEPRRLIRGIPGVELVEMGQSENCCGGGGGVRVQNLDLSLRILKRKTASIREADVQAVVTCCPTCIRQIRAGLSREGLRHVRVVHLAAIMAEALS